VASTYSCANCCPDGVYQTGILPSYLELQFGTNGILGAVQTDFTCNQTLVGPYSPSGVGWHSDNDNVVSVFDGELFTQGVGTATIAASWETCLWWVLDGQCDPVCDQRIEYGSVAVAPSVTNVTASGATKITQINGDPKIFHFATPKGASSSQVTLTATLSHSSEQILNDISWDGAAESASNPLIATVSKDSASKKVVKILYKGKTVKELRVWVVWATLTGGVNAPTSTPVTTSGGLRVGTTVKATFTSTAAIQPSSIITDTDRPNLAGAKTTNPPGGTNVSGQPLSGGATLKWDMSRRIKIRATTQTPPFNPTVLVDGNDDFPSNLVIGNDDAGVGDENNNPYTNNAQLTSSDEPSRAFALQGGNVTDDYRSQLWFQEFARLEIEGVW
jgi:hypothetical protein